MYICNKTLLFSFLAQKSIIFYLISFRVYIYYSILFNRTLNCIMLCIFVAIKCSTKILYSNAYAIIDIIYATIIMFILIQFLIFFPFCCHNLKLYSKEKRLQCVATYFLYSIIVFIQSIFLTQTVCNQMHEQQPK